MKTTSVVVSKSKNSTSYNWISIPLLNVAQVPETNKEKYSPILLFQYNNFQNVVVHKTKLLIKGH